MPGRRLATIVTTLTLALPGAALAQSAGDEEYQNPLPTPAPAEPDPAPQAQPEQAQAAAPAQADQAGTAATAAAPADTLPRTGLPAGAVAAAGILLLGSGAALRRRA